MAIESANSQISEGDPTPLAMIWRAPRLGGRLDLGLELADNLPTRAGGRHDSFDTSQDRL
jgi:hypothetical protein